MRYGSYAVFCFDKTGFNGVLKMSQTHGLSPRLFFEKEEDAVKWIERNATCNFEWVVVRIRDTFSVNVEREDR